MTSAPTETRVRALERRLQAVLEPAIQRALVDECLASLDDDECFALLAHVFDRGATQGSTFDPLRDLLHAWILEGAASIGARAYDRRRALYDRAHATSHAVLMRMLRSGARPGASPDAPLELPRDLADIPLGRRRALARGADLRLLEQLRLDPDPVVIAHLLQNPRTETAHVVRLASMRPIAPSTLEAIHASPRWSGVLEVRLALARNPHCPLPLALKQLQGLPRSELRDIARDGTLAPELQEQARSEVERRRRGAR